MDNLLGYAVNTRFEIAFSSVTNRLINAYFPAKQLTYHNEINQVPATPEVERSRPMSIYVCVDKLRFPINVSTKDTILHVKNIIEAKLEVGADHQTIRYADRELIDGTLESNDVFNGATIFLEDTLNLNVCSSDNKCYDFVVSGVWTIAHLKDIIQRETGVEAIRQILKYKGNLLRHGTIWENAIYDKSTLSLDIDPMLKLKIWCFDGQTFTININENSQVSSLIDFIKRTRGLEVDCLEYNGHKLTNDTLKKNNVQYGAEIYLICKKQTSKLWIILFVLIPLLVSFILWMLFF